MRENPYVTYKFRKIEVGIPVMCISNTLGYLGGDKNLSGHRLRTCGLEHPSGEASGLKYPLDGTLNITCHCHSPEVTHLSDKKTKQTITYAMHG